MARRAVFLVILLVSASAAQESDLDSRLFRRINSSQNPDRNGFFEYLDLSTLPTFAAVPAGFLIVGAVSDNQSAVLVGSMSAVGQITALGLTAALKELIARPRPFDALEDVQVKHRWSAGGFSFPSGHTSQAFSIATVISLKYQRVSVTIPLFLWAASVGIGRVYLGVHYPSDVLGGMAIGVASGLVAWSLRSELNRFSSNVAGSEELNLLPFSEVNLISLRIPYN
jgi:undecaprenyl-diphosphatase